MAVAPAGAARHARRMRHAAALALAVATLVAAPAAARAGDGTNLLGMVPATAETVGVIDLADGRGSAVFTAAVEAALARSGDLRAAFAELGVDPLADLDTLLFALHDDGGAQLDVVIVEGKIPAGAAAADGGAVAKKHKGARYVVDGELARAVVGKRLFLAPADRMPAVLDLAAAGKKAKKKPRGSVAGATSAAALRAAIADVDTRHDVWIASLATEELAAGSRGQGFELAALTLGISAGADLAVQVRLRFVDAAAASKLDTLIAAALPQVRQAVAGYGLAGAVDSISVARDGDRLELGVSVPQAELTTLVGLLQMF